MADTLITGATGFVGREVLRQLLRTDEQVRLTALVRAPDDATLRQRHLALVAGMAARDADRVDAVRGDVTRPHLGMAIHDYAALHDTIDRVVHCAASTRFDLPIEVAQRENVDGTAHVIALCRSLRARGRSGRLDHVSTAFVAGRRHGLVSEDELEAGQTFRNTYERTKLAAEVLCRRAQAEIPVVIHRPSIVVGRQSSGETTSYKAAYGPLRLLIGTYDTCPALLNRFVPLPLPPEVRVDLVPVDYVAHAIATLWRREDAVGRCYHLAAGHAGAASIRELVDLTCDFFGSPRLRLLTPGASLRLAGRTVMPVLRRVAPTVAGVASILFDYGLAMPTFDTTNVAAFGLAAPPVPQYFEAILRYAVRSNFGRRVGSRLDRSPDPRDRRASARAATTAGRRTA